MFTDCSKHGSALALGLTLAVGCTTPPPANEPPSPSWADTNLPPRSTVGSASEPSPQTNSTAPSHPEPYSAPVSIRRLVARQSQDTVTLCNGTWESIGVAQLTSGLTTLKHDSEAVECGGGQTKQVFTFTPARDIHIETFWRLADSGTGPISVVFFNHLNEQIGVAVIRDTTFSRMTIDHTSGEELRAEVLPYDVTTTNPDPGAPDELRGHTQWTFQFVLKA